MRAHDVRRLKICSRCRRPGLPEDLLETDAGLLHGRCALKALSEADLFALPPGQQGKLTLEDVGVDLMKRMIEAQDRAARVPPASSPGQGCLHP